MVTYLIAQIVISLLCVNSVVGFTIDNVDQTILIENKLNISLKAVQGKISDQLNALEQENKDSKSLAENNMNDLEKRINRKLDVVQRLGVLSNCKEYPTERKSYTYNNIFPIDQKSLRYVTVRKANDKSSISYFEMHVAIRGSDAAVILLSPLIRPQGSDLVFEIGVGRGSNKFTAVKKSMRSVALAKEVDTPDLLSDRYYRNFYVKISNKTLTFGKDGEPPLLTYDDALLDTVKYFGFSYWSENEVKVLYDCPALEPFV